MMVVARCMCMCVCVLQTFNENEYRKLITVPIIKGSEYEADVDFYVILKNPAGGAGLADPSIARVTIVDDDGQWALVHNNNNNESLLYSAILQ